MLFSMKLLLTYRTRRHCRKNIGQSGKEEFGWVGHESLYPDWDEEERDLGVESGVNYVLKLSLEFKTGEHHVQKLVSDVATTIHCQGSDVKLKRFRNSGWRERYQSVASSLEVSGI